MADSPQTVNSRRALAHFAQLTVIYNVAVILWGACVRATGSGAGCGGHWPLCNGEIIPTTARIQTIIEFVHRVTSGTALVMIGVLLVWCWRRTEKGDWARYSSLGALILVLNEAVLGALLVLFDKVGMDRSAGRVVFLCLHFANTLLLLAALTLTARWLSRESSRFALSSTKRERVLIGLGLASLIFVGITGAVAALGDTIFPATSLRNSLQQDFSAGGSALLRLRLIHPVAAAIAALYTVWLIFRLYEPRHRSRHLRTLIAAAVGAQLTLGILNVVFLAPVGLQIVHLLVADLLWILLVLASAELLLQERSGSDNRRIEQGAAIRSRAPVRSIAQAD